MGWGESDEKPFPILRFVDWPSENWVLFYSSDFECRTFFLFICLIFLPVVMHLQCFVVSHVAWNQECDIYHEARSYKCQVLRLPLELEYAFLLISLRRIRQMTLQIVNHWFSM